MFRGLKAFKKELNDFAKDVPRGGIIATRRVAVQWFSEVVETTPVKTGFASSMWKYTINQRPFGGKIKHPGGTSYTGARTPAFTRFKPGDTLYIFNNVEYIKPLEDGWSAQAPVNFFKNSARRADRRLQKEYDRLRWKNGKLT